MDFLRRYGIFGSQGLPPTPPPPATVTGAQNGLSLNGTIVELGGPLLQDTTVDGLFNLNLGTQLSRLQALSLNSINSVFLSANDGNYDTYFSLNAANGENETTFTDLTSTAFTNLFQSGSYYNISLTSTVGNVSILLNNTLGFTSPFPLSNGGNNFIVIQDTISNKGAIYADDYSANFTPESLITKRYVDNSILAAAITADNGLTITGNNVQLGGDLLQSTDITGAFNLNLGTSLSNLADVNVNSVNTYITSKFSQFDTLGYFNADGALITLLTRDNTLFQNSQINISPTNIDVTANTTISLASPIVNIGQAGATINMYGTLNNIETTNTQIKDSLVTLNKGGGVGTAQGSGIEIEELGSVVSYIKIGTNRTSVDIKTPDTSSVANISTSTLTANRTYTLPDSNGTIALLSDINNANVIAAIGYTPYNATNPSGYISGITSGMVTTALGYTPYNATNPSGYITNAVTTLPSLSLPLSQTTGVLPIANGGTNSGTALVNNRMMISSGGAIVAHTAQTANQIAFYNASGLPIGDTGMVFNSTNKAITLTGNLTASIYGLNISNYINGINIQTGANGIGIAVIASNNNNAISFQYSGGGFQLNRNTGAGFIGTPYEAIRLDNSTTGVAAIGIGTYASFYAKSPTVANGQLNVGNLIYSIHATGAGSDSSTFAISTLNAGVTPTQNFRFVANRFAIGSGITAPTAFLDITASTAQAASLRYRVGTAPTTPNDGDNWYDNTTLNLATRMNGLTHNQISSIGVITADSVTTIAGANIPLTLTVGEGTFTLPANYLRANRTLKLRLIGTFIRTGGNFSFALTINGTSVVATQTPSNPGAGGLFDFEVLITCRTTGAAGTGRSNFTCSLNNGTTDVNLASNTVAAFALNTTIANTIGVTYNNTGTGSITISNGYLELIN